MILGITGTMGSGKGAAVEYLKTKGFEHYTYSDILRDIAGKRNIEPTRENLQKLGLDIKIESRNMGVLSQEMLKKIKTDKAIVDGVRNVDEIEELKKKKGVYILGVTAGQRVRYKRMRKRNREGDPVTFSEFKRLDNLENRGKTKGQEINNCLKMTDFLIENNGTMDKLKKKIDEVLEKISA
jgi:dephospho-CoA kinase